MEEGRFAGNFAAKHLSGSSGALRYKDNRERITRDSLIAGRSFSQLPGKPKVSVLSAWKDQMTAAFLGMSTLVDDATGRNINDLPLKVHKSA